MEASDVVAHQAIIQNIIVPRGEAEHACIERSTLVPQARHRNGRAESVMVAMSAAIIERPSALLFRRAQGRESATTSVPVPSLVKISASKLSADL